MKKLKLKALELGAKDVLTREQLKNVLGGDGGSGGGCKDACETGMTCSYLSNPLDPNSSTSGTCSGVEKCNGTDGKEYLVKYCK